MGVLYVFLRFVVFVDNVVIEGWGLCGRLGPVFLCNVKNISLKQNLTNASMELS